MYKCFCRWIGWTVFAGAGLPLWATGDPAPQSAVVRVQVYNLAHVRSKDLARAEREAAVIFAKAGIAVSWSEGLPNDRQELATDFSANAMSFGSCTGRSQATELKVQLLRATPRNTLPGALGYALPCAKFGMIVTVFVDRCEDVMYHTLASLPKILAHAMAHEIGHALLGSNEHSHSGIMRGRWTTADLLLLATDHMTFLPEQAEHMRRELSVSSYSNGRAELAHQSVR